MEILLPEGWPRPKGYSNGITASGDTLHIAGQIGWSVDQHLVSSELCPQIRQSLTNIIQVLKAGGAKPTHLVRMIWYVTAIEEYRGNLKEIGKIYREVIGIHYPAMTLIKVAELLERGAKIEIEATAVIPKES